MGRVFPVGTPGGIVSGFSGLPSASGVVRLGSKLMVLDTDRYRIWDAGSAALEADDLTKWASSEGIANAESLVRTLKDSELLIEVGPNPRLLAARVAVRLTGSCLGNGSSGEATFWVRGHAFDPVEVNVLIYELLLRSDGVAPVLELCDFLDRVRPEISRSPCAEIFFDGLPSLVRAGVVRLDLAVR
jgi:hypothetical protein